MRAGVPTIGLMVRNMKDNGKLTGKKDRELIRGRMGGSMTGSIRMIRGRGMGRFSGVMGRSMSGSLRMVSWRGRGLFPGPTVENIQAASKLDISTAKARRPT